MKKVVDTNYLRNPDLRRYLAASQTNCAVLTDYAAMEAYKSSSLRTLYESMAIVCDYPRQVIVLRGTAWACGLRGKARGLQRRLIDQSQTNGFSDFCKHLRAAQNGDVAVAKALSSLSVDAQHQMELVLDDARTMTDALADIQADFTKDELSAIRSGKELPKSVAEKFRLIILQTAGKLFQNHPNVHRLPDDEEYPFTFIFRTALCSTIWAVNWIAEGGQTNIRPERIRNDVVDMNFAVFATYFDGLLTNDQRLARLERATSYMLYKIFPEVIPRVAA